jgi:hypothetical protein
VTAYEKVIATGKTYLGPATEAFVTRQCKWHLKKTPEELATADLAELAKWIEIGAGLVMDKAKATELAGKVRSL